MAGADTPGVCSRARPVRPPFMPVASVLRALWRGSCAWLAVLAFLAEPASAQPAAGTEPLDLEFSRFFRHPVGPRGLELGEALRAADGRRVRLVGYMVAQESPTPGRFMLAPRPVRLSEDADGAADDLPPGVVTVLLAEGQDRRAVAHQPGLLALVGRLQVGRQEDASGRVSWVRLVLAPDALADHPLP